MTPNRSLERHVCGTTALPDGWRWTKLGEVCSLLNGWAFAGGEFAEHGTPLIRIRDLRTNSPSARYAGAFDPRYLVPPGALLVGMDGEFRCYQWAGPPALLNQRVCRLLPDESKIDPTFLSLVINRHLKEIENQTAFTTVKHISSGQILDLTLPLPPLIEQSRIGALLTEQLAAADYARAAVEDQLQAAQALAAAYLREVFDSPEALHWPTRNLGSASEIVSGITLGRRLPPGTDIRPLPFLRVANVKDGYLDLSDLSEIHATDAEISKLRLRDGDLLLTEGGDPDKLGRGTIWRGELLECLHQNHIFRVRFDLAEVAPRFIAAQFNSSYAKRYFLAHAKQTTGIATINQRVLRAFPLLLPPLEVQEQVADAVERFTSAAECLRAPAQARHESTRRLQGALLRAAFNGEL